MNVGNCPRCGRLYVINPREACPSCIKELDQQCLRCIEYLRENRMITIQELSEGTDVPVRQITKFIREGRISIVEAPNLSYECEVCGTPIRDHTMCDSCRKRLVKSMSQIQENDNLKMQESLHKVESYNIKDRLRDRWRK